MKKSYRKIIFSVLMAFVLVFSAALAGCKDRPDDNGGNGGDGGNDKPSFEESDNFLSQNMTSEYRIVIPDDPDERDEFAADELVYFFRQATGITLPVYEEADVTATDHLLIIGDTALRRNAGLTAPDEIGDTGTRLVTKGSNLFLFGKTPFGDINAVYDFLDYTYNYQFYAEECFRIDANGNAKLLNFDYTFAPDIDSMAMMYGELNYGMSLTRRLRSINYYQSWISGMYAHTYYKILPPADYMADHRDWYSPDVNDNTDLPTNLCLTRGGDEMKQEFVERVKFFIEEDETRDYFMLGQEDNFGFCGCPTCLEEIARLGGTSSAVMMQFTNEVVAELNAWLAEEHPDRDVHFMTFAYNNTKTPPVMRDEKGNYIRNADGKMEPVDPSVKAVDNLSVMFVINNVDYAVPYYDDITVMNMLEGWSAITDEITIWQYSTNFENYMEPLFNWGSMQTNYKTLSDYGVFYIAEQGSHNTKTATFTEMRLFVMSQLARNNSLSTAALIDEFMDNYYLDAAPAMKKLFNMYANHCMVLVDAGASVMSGGDSMMNLKNWDFMLLERLLENIDNAIELIEPLKTSDPELYNTLYERVYKESLWIRFCELSYHPTYINNLNAERNKFINDCYRYGVTMPSEGGTWDSVW
ncbi:MAG: hypothetical protein DBX59_04795 [Bacillota bacterium]|nr:MAG: hypothetical protein DBX59_04795 [Bacillota bacterium]